MEPIYRRLQWKLLYRLSVDGTSMITFMDRVENHDVTLVVCEDSKGYKFGAMLFEEW